MTREALAPIREEEQTNACRVLGIPEVIFLRYEDGMLEPSIALRRELTRLIRRHRPDAVLCGDPTVRYYGANYLNHPDHRAAADVTLDAVFPSAETRLIFPELLAEGLEPHKVRWVFIHGAERPDTFIDIADTLGAKLAALKEHRTQMGEWDPDGDDHGMGWPSGGRARAGRGGVLPSHAPARGLIPGLPERTGAGPEAEDGPGTLMA